ncbi:MAG: SOS response-associated peptidase [Methanomicrobium sp.]|nr:SOS response-associated peptidase [Methanomicrobium sp.]
MCGRFVRISPIQVIKKRFRVKHVLPPSVPPSYNVAPNQVVIIITDLGQRNIVPSRWGFLPSWAKNMSIGNKMINARAETVTEKPAFRYAFKKQRCLIVADGFYEWENRNYKKYPVYIKLKHGEPFGFAGLYNLWESPDRSMICTCTIITTVSNDLISPIHQRMPVIMPQDKEDLWLNSAIEDDQKLLPLLMPYPPEDMELYHVTPRMNLPIYNHPENIAPI